MCVNKVEGTKLLRVTGIICDKRVLGSYNHLHLLYGHVIVVFTHLWIDLVSCMIAIHAVHLIVIVVVAVELSTTVVVVVSVVALIAQIVINCPFPSVFLTGRISCGITVRLDGRLYVNRWFNQWFRNCVRYDVRHFFNL